VGAPAAGFLAVLLFVLAAGGLRAVAAADPARPNIVLILADDLGWADVGCHGADLHETPRIDALARDGLRFTQAYAMSVCSPTRAMLLTGRHAARLGLTIWIEKTLRPPDTGRPLLEARSRHDLPRTEITLATRLRAAGYLTALIGKWHLGDGDHFPEAHGFEVNIGGTHWGAPATYWWPYHGPITARNEAGVIVNSEYRYVPHLEFGRPGEYLTDRLTDEALRVIDRAEGRPFFLYVPHYAVHTPIEAKPAEVEYFERKLRPGLRHQNAIYAAMVKSLDDSVGRILDHLRLRGLEKNTVVIFSSDNGGFIGRSAGQTTPVTSNAPLRSGKGSVYEGGIRVPLIVKWPGITSPGRECHEPVMLADLFPTLARFDGPTATTLDGIDLMPLLQNPSARLGREALYFHFPHYHPTTTPVSAVRAGDWKLLEYFEDGRLELYNLARDPSEQTDLASRERERVSALRTRLDQWRRAVGAELPTTSPGSGTK
jgi:arylsulfatase A-like enzyme